MGGVKKHTYYYARGLRLEAHDRTCLKARWNDAFRRASLDAHEAKLAAAAAARNRVYDTDGMTPAI